MGNGYGSIRRFCGWVVGLVFVFSGMLKLMDPVGAGLVMGEYFKFLHLGFLSPLSLPAGIGFAVAETVTGVALATGVWRKLTATIASLLMAFFTILTIILVIFNPTMDCGCFGEVIHLTHVQSLLKNIVIDVLLFIAFVPFRTIGTPKKLKYWTFGIVTSILMALLVYSLVYIPFKDYTDYRIGSRLISSLKDGEEVIFSASFIYEKDGVRKSFTLEDELPDDSWTFVGSEAIPNKDLENMPVLPITRGDEVLDTLAAHGNVLIVSVYNAEKFDAEKKAAAQELIANAETLGFSAMLLSVNPSEGEYQSDYRPLIGLNRANGGVTLIQDGTITRKWGRRDAPDYEELEEIATGEPTEIQLESETYGRVRFHGVMLACFGALLIL